MSPSFGSSSPKSFTRNESMTYSVKVSRHLEIGSEFEAEGSNKHASWIQDLEYSNHGAFTNSGWNHVTNQVSRGSDTSSEGYSRRFNYPVYVEDARVEEANGSFSIDASMNRAQDIRISGQATHPTGIDAYTDELGTNKSEIESTHLYTAQNGSGHYFESPRSSFGSTEQSMTFSASPLGSNDKAAMPSGRGMASVFGDSKSERELYGRHVIAVNATIVEDEERFVESPAQRPRQEATRHSPINLEGLSTPATGQWIMRDAENESDESRLQV